jgi:hypothetical protein
MPQLRLDASGRCAHRLRSEDAERPHFGGGQHETPGVLLLRQRRPTVSREMCRLVAQLAVRRPRCPSGCRGSALPRQLRRTEPRLGPSGLAQKATAHYETTEFGLKRSLLREAPRMPSPRAWRPNPLGEWASEHSSESALSDVPNGGAGSLENELGNKHDLEWTAQLRRPIFTSSSEVAERVARPSRALRCTTSAASVIGGWRDQLGGLLR